MSEESSSVKDVYDIEIDYTPIIISIVVIAVILFLMWFFSGTDVSYSPAGASSVPTAYDISTAFDIVS